MIKPTRLSISLHASLCGLFTLLPACGAHAQGTPDARGSAPTQQAPAESRAPPQSQGWQQAAVPIQATAPMPAQPATQSGDRPPATQPPQPPASQAVPEDTPAAPSAPKQVEFNEVFLRGQGQTPIDISRFAKGNPASPGQYRVDLYVNQISMGRADVTLKQIGDDRDNVQPCFDRTLMERMGVDLARLSSQAGEALSSADADEDAGCATLPQLVSGAVATFDTGEQRLDVSVPQVSMKRQARGYVDPRYWDEGITAGLLQYNANIYRSRANELSSTDVYVGLITGFNLGPWRLRHSGNFNSGSNRGSHYQAIQTQVQRSIASLKSRLVIGEGFTDGSVFDSFGFRGVQLATDDSMYPESQRGYAPTVRGVARTNALVRVTQNGNVIYETTVAPGPFIINDLYPTGYGGALAVTITEADGTRSGFTVPYASSLQALRPGITRFSATAGQYRDASREGRPALVHGTLQHGFNNWLTGYGGLIGAKDYRAGALGAALNTRVGAFFMDVTQTSATLPPWGRLHGESLRLGYSQVIDATDTYIYVSARPYASRNYLDLVQAMDFRYRQREDIDAFPSATGRRAQVQVTINQMLPPGWGSLYLTGSSEKYWDTQNRYTQYQAGYNNSFRRLNYSISVSRQLDLATRRWDDSFTLNVSIPLGRGEHAPYSMTSVQHSTRAGSTVQQSVNGTLGEDNRFVYGVNANSTRGGEAPTATTVGGNVSYMSPYATLTGNASTGRGVTQYSAGVSGGVVAYAGGVAFSPTMSDTVAVVEARDARGARVANASGLRVDRWGRAVAPNLIAFADNEVMIDPKGLPISVELKETSQHTAPTLGAVVRLQYATEGGGRAILLRAKAADGSPVPFGAQVTDASGREVGIVAQGGRILLRGVSADTGEFQLRWGDAPTEQCSLKYELPAIQQDTANRWTTVDAVCVAR